MNGALEQSAGREAFLGRRQAMCEHAARAGIVLACDGLEGDGAELAALIAMGDGAAWWPELAPLTRGERALVRREVCAAFERWTAAGSPLAPPQVDSPAPPVQDGDLGPPAGAR